MTEIAIRAADLGKRYFLRQRGGDGYKNYTALRDVLAEAVKSPLRRLQGRGRTETSEDFWALRDVSFDIQQGEAVGVIGRNGAGKSTLLKLLSRITEPTTGRIELEGKVASLLEVGTGFHPELTGRENVYLNGTILGMKRSEIRRKFDEIVAFAEVEKFLDTPVKHYSSGMYVRLAFAVAAHLEPDILVVDEVLAVGDAQFQKKCLGKMKSVSEREGRTVLFVSHNMQAIRQMCSRVLLLKQGRLAYSGEPHAGISAYLGQGVDTDSNDISDLASYPRNFRPDSAILQRLRFLDEKGRPAHRLDVEQTLQVEVDVRVEKRVRQFDLAMAMVHAEGLRVFSEAYSDEHNLIDLGPGTLTIRFQIPMRFFKSESYFLTLTLSEDGRVCDSIDGILMPEIVNEGANSIMESRRWGVLRVPVKWEEIQPAATAAHP
jgi:lipopolysaccharide transport system ATP-binding protein